MYRLIHGLKYKFLLQELKGRRKEVQERERERETERESETDRD